MLAAASKAIPNFAGVALVDILANGVAVLIIVIVLSIAARTEQEEKFAEKVEEVSAVMTREFSTNLVLNRLAAGDPARLHDYENSAIDAIWNPQIMPIFEIHNDLVRDPYSGQIWRRNELLRSPNSLDRHLETFTYVQQVSVRGDFYDVGTFYLLNSILQDHGIVIRHWHFIGSQPGFGSVVDCPADTLAEDCLASGNDGEGRGTEELRDLLASELSSDRGSSNGESTTDGANWPPEGQNFENGSGGEQSPNVPDGSNLNEQLGPSNGGPMSSFPSVDRDTGSQSSNSGGVRGEGSEGGINLRLANPNSMRVQEDGMQLNLDNASVEDLLRSLMAYLADLQNGYDENRNLEPILSNFANRMQEFVTQPPPLSPEQETIVEDLAYLLDANAARMSDVGDEPLEVTQYFDESSDAHIKLLPNRMMFDLASSTAEQAWASNMQSPAYVRMHINSYPSVWEGLQIKLHRGATLLLVPEQIFPDQPRWRAVTFITPQLDEFIVGFVYGTIDTQGNLILDGEVNSIRIDGLNLIAPSEADFFGASLWLVVLFVSLAASLALLLLFWRPNIRAPA